MASSETARHQYKLLQSEYRTLRQDKKYQEAQQTIDKMIQLLAEHPESFDEVQDRIRVLRCQSIMTAYQEARVHGQTTELIRLLREAAAWSTPSPCLNEPCADFAPDMCLSRQTRLSPRQRRMCVERISYVCDTLKLEAAHATKRPDNPDLETALKKRRDAATDHRIALTLDITTDRSANQRYLDYWQFVTEGQVSLLAGDFDPAKQWFNRAVAVATLLDPLRCFPNFFRDVKELQAQEIFIDALDCVRHGQFRQANELFTKWVNLFPERASRGDARYDNAKLYALACDLLDRLDKCPLTRQDWDALWNFLEDANPSLPSWTLVARLREVSGLDPALFRQGTTDRTVVLAQVAVFSKEWTLFVSDSALLGEDKEAGLQRPVNFPSFLAIFDRLDRDEREWKLLLVQNLKHLFLLLADYEYRRHLDPPDEDRHLAKFEKPVIPSEKMSVHCLAEVALVYLKRRAKAHVARFEQGLGQLGVLEAAINQGDFTKATAIERRIFEAIRSWPHTIRVEGQRELESYFLDQAEPGFLQRETFARRLWVREPRRITFEGVQDLLKDKTYYLRPKWNIRFGERYRIRSERFYQSDWPAMMEVFYENIYGKANVGANRFRKWILQFEDTERLLACRLFHGLEYYDEEKIRKIWAEAFRRIPSEAKTDVAYIGLGHGAKSGRLNPYLFRQGVSTLPEYGPLFAGKERKIFRDIAEYEKEELKLAKPRHLVFLDDFVGTGGQAGDFVDWYFQRYPWLADVAIFLCVLVGFTRAIGEVEKSLARRPSFRGVIVGRALGEMDRAFSPENSIWSSSEECEEAEEWAKDIGQQLLRGNPIYTPERDALGWHGCQALVAFHHNIPSDTLPLFWATGTRNGRSWIPLLERYD